MPLWVYFVIAIVVALLIWFLSYWNRSSIIRETNDFLRFLKIYYAYRKQKASYQDILIFCGKKQKQYDRKESVNFVGKTFYPAMAQIMTDSGTAIAELERAYRYEMDKRMNGFDLTKDKIWQLNHLIADVYFLTGNAILSLDWLTAGIGIYSANSWKKISAKTSKKWIETFTTETAELRKDIRDRVPDIIAQWGQNDTSSRRDKDNLAFLYLLLARDSFPYSIEVQENQEYLEKAKECLRTVNGTKDVSLTDLQKLYRNYTRILLKNGTINTDN